jgi:pyridoxine 5-phosphate synthase
VAGQEARIKAAVERLSRTGAEVSLFIDADERQIEASRRVGAPAIELHTGRYADAETPPRWLKSSSASSMAWRSVLARG